LELFQFSSKFSYNSLETPSSLKNYFPSHFQDPKMVQSMKELHDLEATMTRDGVPDGDSSNGGSASAYDIESSVASTTTPSCSKGPNNSSESSTSLARDETKAVNRSKLAVLFVLTLAAIGVGTATYFFAYNTETNEFEGQVRDNSCRLICKFPALLSRFLPRFTFCFPILSFSVSRLCHRNEGAGS